MAIPLLSDSQHWNEELAMLRAEAVTKHGALSEDLKREFAETQKEIDLLKEPSVRLFHDAIS